MRHVSDEVKAILEKNVLTAEDQSKIRAELPYYYRESLAQKELDGFVIDGLQTGLTVVVDKNRFDIKLENESESGVTIKIIPKGYPYI